MPSSKNKLPIADVAGDISDDFDVSSDDEGVFPSAGVKKAHLPVAAEDSDDDEVVESDDDDDEAKAEANDTSKLSQTDQAEGEAKDDKVDEAGDDNKEQPKSQMPDVLNKKLKKMTPERLAKEQKRIKKTGVVHLTLVPPFMQPAKLRQIMLRFGPVGRIFLQPEEESVRQKRIKYGGNKRQNFVQGWVEFEKKKHAKLCAFSMNGQKIGGNKKDRYYDDILNLRYLRKYTWQDLQQQLATENEVRQAKLALEVSRQNKVNKTFVENVETAKMIERAKKRRAAAESEDKREHDEDEKVRRTFKQRKIASARADADASKFTKEKAGEQLELVINQIF